MCPEVSVLLMFCRCPWYMIVLLMKFFFLGKEENSPMHLSSNKFESSVDTLSSNLYSLHSVNWTVKNLLTWHRKPLFPHSLAASQRLHLETKIPVLTLGKSCVCRYTAWLSVRLNTFCDFVLHFTCSTFVLLTGMESHLCLVI
jgi:hypothetical protein